MSPSTITPPPRHSQLLPPPRGLTVKREVTEEGSQEVHEVHDHDGDVGDALHLLLGGAAGHSGFSTAPWHPVTPSTRPVRRGDAKTLWGVWGMCRERLCTPSWAGQCVKSPTTHPFWVTAPTSEGSHHHPWIMEPTSRGSYHPSTHSESHHTPPRGDSTHPGLYLQSPRGDIAYDPPAHPPPETDITHPRSYQPLSTHLGLCHPPPHDAPVQIPHMVGTAFGRAQDEAHPSPWMPPPRTHSFSSV